MPKEIFSQKSGVTYTFPDEMPDDVALGHVRRLDNLPQGGTQELSPPRSEPTSTKGIETLRQFVIPSVAGAAGALFKNPAIGAGAATATGFGLDAIIQAIEGAQRPKSTYESLTGTENPAASTAEMLGTNILGGKLIEPLYKYGKSALAAGAGISAPILDTSVKDFITKMGGTFSMYAKRPIAKAIEDIAAAGTKSKRLDISAALGKEEGVNLASKLSGRLPELISNPQEMAHIAGNELSSGFEQAGQAATLRAEGARSIAEQKIQPIISLVNGKPVITSTVKGPIYTSTAYDNAVDYLRQYPQGLASVPDAEKKIFNTANEIVSRGKDVPISFKDAWKMKQQLDAIGVFSVDRPDVKGANIAATGFAKALNNDIETSIPKWGEGSDIALKSWQEAKAIAGARNDAFSGEAANMLRAVAQTPDRMRAVVKNDVELQNVLNAGKLEIPGIGKITSTNVKKDLQGFALQDILNKAWDAESGRFNAKTLINLWKDPEMKNSYGLLFSNAGRSEVDHFITALSNVSQKQMLAGQIAAKIRVGGAGITLASGLLTKGIESLASAGESRALGVTGLFAGLNVVGKILANPKAARYFTDLVEGRALGVSDAFAARMIVGAMQGVSVRIQMSDGTSVLGKIIKGNRFVPLNANERANQ